MLNKLIKRVNKNYDLKIKKKSLIKKDSAMVVKLTDQSGTKYALKTLYTNKQRQEFIARSELLLSKKGVKLAKPIPTTDNKLYFIYRGHPYVLYEWAEGERHPLNNSKDLESLVKTIAGMHKASYNLNFPKKTKVYRNTNWNREYKKRLKFIKQFYQTNKNSVHPRLQAYLHALPFFSNMGKKALKLLANSKADSLSKKYKEQILVHGDAHQGNILNHDQEKTIIDLEDIRYDLPSKDLIRIFAKYTKRHKFEGEVFEKMLNSYEKINPLGKKKRKVVLIDFLFPNTIYRMLRLKKYKIQSLGEVKEIIKQEKKMARYISQLLANYDEKDPTSA
ncbi:phosphotransferase [Ammoniphilus sp. CFH 90114]|uniref:phosphotransferase n=1 Tax=Ammoniphilus sp. CFH 90114 TaxID=2493665 RepID=UPI0013E98660|nr:phosphotransferase [Ammoniphilus sp. CFH 90114]